MYLSYMNRLTLKTDNIKQNEVGLAFIHANVLSWICPADCSKKGISISNY
jgi:hypothetical protein